MIWDFLQLTYVVTPHLNKFADMVRGHKHMFVGGA